MAIKSFYRRHDDIRDEARKAWAWLRKLPKYRADYNKQDEKAKIDSIFVQEGGIKRKYGFFPLISPKEKLVHKHAPFEFFVAFGKLMGQHPFDSGVKFKNLDYIDLDAHDHPERYKNIITES